MKRTVLIGILIILIGAGSVPLMAQNDSLVLIKTINCSASFITPDILGNIYVLEGGKLSCYDSLGNFRLSFSNLTDGSYKSVDVNDPLKLLLFSSEFSRIRFLDQNLAQKLSAVDLMDLGYFDIGLCCSSYESGFWIYDASALQLLRFDSRAELEQSSTHLPSAVGEEVHPVFMAEFENLLYMSDTSLGILVFDRYGGYLKTMPFKGVRSFQWSNRVLFYFTAEGVWAYIPEQQSETLMKYPVSGVIGACLSRGYLYLLDGMKLRVYGIL